MLKNDHMIRVEHLRKSYGEKVIFDDLTLTLPLHACTALMGTSGIGKTTLGRIIYGLEEKDGGLVTGLEGLKKSFVFQENRLLPTLSAVKNILCVQKDEDKALYYLEKCGLSEDKNKKVSAFSGGMKRRLAIAKALAYGGDAFFWDEPLRELDAENTQKMLTLLKNELAGKTVLLITHEAYTAKVLAQNILLCENRPMTVTECSNIE